MLDDCRAVGRVDVVCGDLNAARWQSRENLNWHEDTLDILEDREFVPIADYSGECCFVAVHRGLVESLQVRGSSWGERYATLSDEAAPAAEEFRASFLRQCGAKATSRDVHWPMTVSFRAPVGPSLRASGFRQRSAGAIQRRNEKKAKRGHGPLAKNPAKGGSKGGGDYGRSRGSGEMYGRSSGSGYSSGPHGDGGWDRYDDQHSPEEWRG